MDAADTLLKKTVLFSALALFVMAAGLHAQPAFNTPGTLQLSLGGGNVNITGTGDPATPITFDASLSNFTVPGSNPPNWVSFVNGSTTSSGLTTPAQLGFLVRNTGSTQGTFSATVNLTPNGASATAGVAASSFTVTYISGSSGGGGGGSNGTITASTTNLVLSTTPGSFTTGTITLSTTSTGSINFNLTYSPSNSWLSVSPSSGTVSSTSSVTLQVLGNANNISSNQTGSITVTPSSGTPTSIAVTLNVSGGGGGGGNGQVTATPNPVNIAYNSNSGNFPTQFVSLQTTTGASTYSATSSSLNGWLLANGGSSSPQLISSGLQISVSGNVTNLVTGNYMGTVSVQDASGGSGSITVNLSVNGGSTNGLTLSPSNGLTFSGAVGSGNTSPQTMTITSSVAGALSVSCTPTSSWLQCSGIPSNIFANSQTNITVVANAASLANLTYNGQFSVTVTPSNGTPLSGSVPISFVVGTGSGGGGGGGGQSGFAVSPTSLVFTYQTGTSRGSVPQQIVGITGSANNNYTVNTSVASPTNGTWLTSSISSAQFQPDGTSSTKVGIDPNGLAAGTYTGTAGVVSNGVTQSVGVTLNVVSTPILVANPGALLFNYHTGDPTLQPQSINLSASDGSAITGTATTTTSWLTVNQAAGATAFSVTANPGSMAGGMYTGAVTVTQSNLGASPLTIPVTLIINGGSGGGGGGGGSGTLTLNPTVLNFNAALNGSSPGGQTISVTASSSTSFTITTATTSGGSWLSANQSGGTTPSSIIIFANSTSLGLGTYNGTVTFSVNGTNQVVSVVLSVTTTGSGGGSISVDKSSLSFSGQAGGANPASQVVNITSSSGSQVSVTTSATTSSGGNWLSISANSSVTPVVLTVNASVAAVTAGTYNGNIAVTPTGGTTVNIPVSLTVTAPPAVSASPTSLTFTYRVGDPTPATQNITVSGGAALGFTATATSNGNWLNVTPASGTTPGTVTVGVSPSSLNASTTPYTGTITVAGSGGATGTTTITVTLTVTAPLPTVSKVTNAASFATATAVSPGEIITLFASDAQHPIGPSTPVGLTLDSTGKVATTIGGVQVLASGFACPMVYASATQVSAVVPYELAGFVFSGADILVKYVGQTSNAVHVNVATTQPGLFTANSSGTGPGAILNSNGSVNTPSNPASKGDIVVVYLTGEGQTTPAGVTGKVTTVSSTPPLTPAPLLPIAILIGPNGAQQAANYTFAGEAPGIVSGGMQLNVQIPTTVNSGDLQLIVSIGPNSSQTGVTVSVK